MGKEAAKLVSPFDIKNKAASRIDRIALTVLTLILCIAHFTRLFGGGAESLAAGLALFALIMLTFALFERSTLTRRDRALRERLGGEIALLDLLLLPSGEAATRVRDTLCQALDAAPEGQCAMRYAGEKWLVRLAQCAKGASAGEGDVLAAHRARQEADAQQCALLSTGGFTPSAIRAAEWMDPPIRLIPGPQLAALLGRLSPATDADIARHAARQKKPFSFARIRLLALSPAKQKKYLLCSFLLLVLYLLSGSMACLTSSLLSLLLAILCKKENSRVFRL